jgi:hypothetical protein
MMADEFKEMYPLQAADPEIKLALKSGLEGFKSDSTDFILDHSTDFPVSIVLFYDCKIYFETIMQSLSTKLIDVFIYKYKHHLEIKNYKDFTPTNSIYNQIGIDEIYQRFEWTENPATSYEAALPLIFEDVS